MLDENGNIMTEKQIIMEAMNLISDACCLLFETTEDYSIAAAYMADSLLKYLQVIHRDDDVLLAAADYSSYENEIYQKKINERNVIPMSKL